MIVMRSAIVVFIWSAIPQALPIIPERKYTHSEMIKHHPNYSNDKIVL